MRFRVTAGFVLLAAFLLFCDNNGILLWFTAVMLIHELAHIAVLLALGGRVAECRLSVWGMCLSADGLSYGRELAAVLAGPAASLITAFAASKAGWTLAAGISLVAGVYNLLPARCLDGGRAVELLLLWHFSPVTAYKILRITTLLSALILILPLCAAFTQGVYNWTLLLSAALIGVSAFCDTGTQ